MKILVLLALLGAGVNAHAKIMRATEMGTSVLNDIAKGSLEDITIEFRQGDEIPVTFSAGGDLFESTQNSVGYLGIKRNFWIRMEKNSIQMSLDNISYNDIQKVVGGSFEAGTGADQSGGPANALNLVLKAFLR
jgi:hypothetical protein